MASHLVGIASGGGGASATAVVDLGTTTAGDLVVASLGWYLGSFTSIADTYGNTWTLIGAESALGGGSSQFYRMYYSVLATGGASHGVTFTASGSGTYPTIAADVFTGGTGWALDQTAVASPGTSNTTGSSGVTGTRGTATQLLVGGVSTAHINDTTFTAGANIAWVLGAAYGLGTLSVPVAQEYFFATAPGTDAAEWSWVGTQFWAARVATFSFADAGGGGGELTWMPQQQVAAGAPGRMVASGMTPPGRAV